MTVSIRPVVRHTLWRGGEGPNCSSAEVTLRIRQHCASAKMLLMTCNSCACNAKVPAGAAAACIHVCIGVSDDDGSSHDSYIDVLMTNAHHISLTDVMLMQTYAGHTEAIRNCNSKELPFPELSIGDAGGGGLL